MKFRSASTVAVLVLVTSAATAHAQVRRTVFQGNGSYLVLEALDDDLLHFETGSGNPPGRAQPIRTSAMVSRTTYPGARQFSSGTDRVTTADMDVVVAPGTLCFTITEKARGIVLTTICPVPSRGGEGGLTLSRNGTRNVYGLGQQFVEPGASNGDWVGKQRTPGNEFGNRMVGFDGGAVGNSQFPVMYALGEGGVNYALFVDVVQRQGWDFRADPFQLRTTGAPVRGYVMTGADLPDLRRDYLELVGMPPVPPRQAFGLWVSEYGFDHWHELEGKLASLRKAAFPVDGFVLDLQWFGGIITGSDLSTMGSLSWDTKKFPDPRRHIARLRNAEGVGIIPIEEPYVARGLAEHDVLARRGFLVRQARNGPPLYLTENPWWGMGGMIDFTNPAASTFWHEWKRRALMDAGVMGHWTDLGEPEIFDAKSWNHGVEPGRHSQGDVHNVYNLKWSQSIFDGYARNGSRKRPFILSRSGTSGSQRYGVSMWSGDIGANFASLATHMNAQMHMSMSGMDYFGSDVGGFHRGAIRGDSLNELYTQWFANAAMIEAPIRAHTENLCNCKETAPDRVGHVPSNLANLRLRYSLTPYYYSLAHRARLHAEPIIAPLVHYYQADANVREIGDVKLIGRDLLVGVTARHGQRAMDIYLPAGAWHDFRTQQRHEGGRWLRSVSLEHEGNFQLPLYARAGAIIPRMHIDERSTNVLGRRTDGSVRSELIARVYPDAVASSFILYEDDGETIAYRQGAVATTTLTQRATGSDVLVTIGARAGRYAGAPATRDNVIELATGGRTVTSVSVDGVGLTRRDSRAALDAAGSGWLVGDGLVIARTGSLPVLRARALTFSSR